MWRGIDHGKHLPQGQKVQLASLERDPAAYALLSVREVIRIVTGKIVYDTQGQRSCSQYPNYPAVPDQEEHSHTGT